MMMKLKDVEWMKVELQTAKEREMQAMQARPSGLENVHRVEYTGLGTRYLWQAEPRSR